jgi:uncharacterized membrane protein
LLPRLNHRGDETSTDLQVEKIVRRPRPEVAAYSMDYRNEPEWIGAISESRLVSDGDFGVGSRVSRTASFLGKRIEYVNEVVEYEPGRRLLMRSVQAPFPMTVSYEFEDTGDGTRVRIRAQGDAAGFYRFGGPLLTAAVKRAIAGDLRRLKQQLESRPGSLPGD